MKLLYKIKTIICLLAFSASNQLLASANNLEIVVPFPPGGTVDIIARALQQEMQKRLPDVNTIVINKPGGDGVVATQYFLGANSNSLLMSSTGTSLFLKLSNPKIDFDPINDFVIQGPIATASTVLAVRDQSPLVDLDTFFRTAKQRNLTCGTSNAMAVFFGRYISNEYDLKITLVPYKGSANVLSDLVGGHIDCAIDVLPVYLSRTDTKVIALSVPDRSRKFNAPILARGDYRFENFYAVVLNQRMDARLKDRLKQMMLDLAQDQQFARGLADRGVALNPSFRNSINDRLNRDYEYLSEFQRRFIDRVR